MTSRIAVARMVALLATGIATALCVHNPVVNVAVDVTPTALYTKRVDMAWTMHGYHIPDSPYDIEEAPLVRARCGGARLCELCKTEELRYRMTHSINPDAYDIFKAEVAKLINRESIDAIIGVPDFILSELLTSNLKSLAWALESNNIFKGDKK